MSEASRIVDELSREYDGEPWHGSPLREILRGIDAAQAAGRPIAGAHTIWELVLHITAWKNEVRRRLTGAAAGTPDEGDWPEVGTPGAERWTDALDRLQAAHRNLLDAVEKLPEAQLHAATNDPRAEDAPGGVSYYVLLHGSVQHDVYHAGQIALLKKCGPD